MYEVGSTGMLWDIMGLTLIEGQLEHGVTHHDSSAVSPEGRHEELRKHGLSVRDDNFFLPTSLISQGTEQGTKHNMNGQRPDSHIILVSVNSCNSLFTVLTMEETEIRQLDSS